MLNLNVNFETKIGVGAVAETFDGQTQVTKNIPMQLVLLDGVAVAYKRVDVDNLSGSISFGRILPIDEVNFSYMSELVDFKAISENEFYKAVDKLVEKRFNNKRKEFVERTVRVYSENEMLRALDRCLFNFDNERYQREDEQYDIETREFFNNLFD